jgi:hypothetical protein
VTATSPKICLPKSQSNSDNDHDWIVRGRKILSPKGGVKIGEEVELESAFSDAGYFSSPLISRSTRLSAARDEKVLKVHRNFTS